MEARLILRHDGDWVADDISGLSHTLNRGEVGALITDAGTVEVRVGVEDNQPFDICPVIGHGSPGIAGITIDDSTLANLSVLTWNTTDSKFSRETTTIDIPTNASGALRFDAAQSKFIIDSAATVVNVVDGGLYNEGAEAPQFISEPAIGVAG